MRTLIGTLAALVVMLALGAASPAATQQTLTATVGPGFTISIHEHGKLVKSLAPAHYTLVVDDKSSIHNFHLTGPGINKKTSVAKTGKTVWHVTFRKGTYHYVCDPHKTIMKGSFIVKAP